jgi:predicted transcriptional regulator
MATNLSEILPVRLPKGTREKLAKIAERRLESSCSVARKAIVAEVERALREQGETRNAA